MVKATLEHRGLQLASDIEYANDVVNLTENLKNPNCLVERVIQFSDIH